MHDLAVSFARQVLQALSAAHGQKIIHRDVKPANVLVGNGGHCSLIDFSIGVSLDSASPGLTRVTTDAHHPGTVDYMAPEQRTGENFDHRADLYATGIVLFEMLAGHPRINLETLDGDLAHAPKGLREILRRGCQPDPAARFASASTFTEALGGFEASPAFRGDRRWAVCANLACKGADWSPNGYYRGPLKIEDCQDKFCEHCGEQLAYPCDACGKPFNGNQFCGSCGTCAFDLPLCEQCGSFLQSGDMGADTAASGCAKCRRKGTAVISGGNEDDDIPF